MRGGDEVAKKVKRKVRVEGGMEIVLVIGKQQNSLGPLQEPIFEKRGRLILVRDYQTYLE